MDSLGIELELSEEEYERSNGIGYLNRSGKQFMFNGRMGNNMIYAGEVKDPFGAEVKDGWMYGMGTVNMKSGDPVHLGAIPCLHCLI